MVRGLSASSESALVQGIASGDRGMLLTASLGCHVRVGLRADPHSTPGARFAGVASADPRRRLTVSSSYLHTWEVAYESRQ